MKKILIILIASALFLVTTNQTYAAEVINGPDIVYVDKDQGMTISGILSIYEAEGSKLEIVSEDFTGNANKKGDYTLIIRVKGSYAQKEVSIKVLSETSNKIYLAGKTGTLFTIYTSEALTEDDILKALGKIGAAKITSTTGYVILNDTYTDNKEVSGSYTFEYRLSDKTGLQQHGVAEIVVMKKNNSGYINLGGDFDYNILIYVGIGIVVLIIGVKFLKKKR